MNDKPEEKNRHTTAGQKVISGAEKSAAQQEPRSQGGMPKRLREFPVPTIVKQFPFWPFNHVPEFPNETYQLIDLEELDELAEKDADIDAGLIQKDMAFLEYELLRLFRTRDHLAKKHQLRYQRFQILYLTLAAIAGFIGSLMALNFSSNPQLMPVFSFAETLVALLAVFLATISGRQSPLLLWLQNRQRAEALRREYFRYITRVPPYNGGKDFELQMLLALRAANINRGVDPPKNLSTNNGGK